MTAASFPNLSAFRVAVNKAKKISPFTGTLLALDPGETTGWARFSATPEQLVLEEFGQAKTWPIDQSVSGVTELLGRHAPTVVVMESYRVYEWKTDDHSWSSVPTLQLIGCIKTLSIQRNTPFYEQTAQIAKNFCTDERLKTWGMYPKGLRHARDAIRHGIYYLLFGTQSDP